MVALKVFGPSCVNFVAIALLGIGSRLNVVLATAWRCPTAKIGLWPKAQLAFIAEFDLWPEGRRSSSLAPEPKRILILR